MWMSKPPRRPFVTGSGNSSYALLLIPYWGFLSDLPSSLRSLPRVKPRVDVLCFSRCKGEMQCLLRKRVEVLVSLQRRGERVGKLVCHIDAENSIVAGIDVGFGCCPDQINQAWSRISRVFRTLTNGGIGRSPFYVRSPRRQQSNMDRMLLHY